MSGADILADRYRNKGTAFTDDERTALGLHGLLPPVVEDLATQLRRVRLEYDAKSTDLGRHVFLRALQERNSVLFYAFLASDLPSLLPIVYTPTVGLACQEFSRIYRREHGLVISPNDRERIPELFDHAVGDAEVDVIVATDGERILGLGDLGVGGMGIPIGKLALYTAGGGLDPGRTLPVMIDVGTENESLLSDPLYLGRRQRRLRGAAYDELLDAFVDAVADRFPGALLQWEDFAQVNATRLLHRHRDRVCSFNDDIQGTAVVTTAALEAGMNVAGVPLTELRVVIVGAGSAGVGIAEQIVRALVAAGVSPDDARSRCWLVDREGVLHDRLPGGLDFQRPFVRSWDDVASWDDDGDGRVGLAQVVAGVSPHALVGVTGQPGLFTEDVIRLQADAVARPIVLPLSNPTPRAEAIPADVLEWTDGRALIGTGSPFDPVRWAGRTHTITQVNNLYAFPGIGLGVIASRARRVSDAMLTAAAGAIGGMAPGAADPAAGLLPPITACRDVARHVARAVGEAAMEGGEAERITAAELDARIDAISWAPEYRPV